jgi:hypothetical protein
VAHRTGHLVVNVTGIKDILPFLLAKPHVTCQVLCPMLAIAWGWTEIPAQDITNFPKRVLLFLIKNLTNYEHLTYEQAVSMSSKKCMSADEMTELDDPLHSPKLYLKND